MTSGNGATSGNAHENLNVVIAFIMAALVVYVITSVLMREAPKEPDPPTKVRPFCKEAVPAEATKCRVCTSAI